jgi:putative hydrolase of the HAD superfamily
VPETVLCDFDGVIRRWSEDDMTRIEIECGLPAGTVLGAAFRPELLRAATTGLISDEEWRATTAESLAVEYGDGARTAVAAWSELSGEIDHEMLERLRRARKAVPLVWSRMRRHGSIAT